MDVIFWISLLYITIYCLFSFLKPIDNIEVPMGAICYEERNDKFDTIDEIVLNQEVDETLKIGDIDL